MLNQPDQLLLNFKDQGSVALQLPLLSDNESLHHPPYNLILRIFIEDPPLLAIANKNH
jgi:hypothetical protein